jgi:hypothetical protein
MRQNWLPTQLQSSFRDMIKQRVAGSMRMSREMSVKLEKFGIRLSADATLAR